MSEHTPTPWTVVKSGGIAIGVGIRINSADQAVSVFRMIGNVMDRSDEPPDMKEINANAEFIVRAVNCHDELLFTLKEIADTIQGGDKLASCALWAQELITKARAAIAKAEGKE